MSTLALGLKLSAIKTLSAVQRAINILKSAGPGAWYDPSDIASYTAPVGPELVTDGTFDTGTAGWISAGGAHTWTGSALRRTIGQGDAGSYSDVGGFVVGKTYRLTASISNTTLPNGVVVNAYAGAAFSPVIGSISPAAPTPLVFVATSTVVRLYLYCNNTSAADFDNISARELPNISACTMFQDSAGTTPVTAVEQPVGLILDKSGGGNHLIQPTATSRPTLSSRYNLLTKTEQFDDAAWPKTNLTVTANSTVAPDGTTTAEKIVENTTASVSHYIRQMIYTAVASGTVVTYSLYAKAGERTRFGMIDGYANKGAVFDLSNGTVVGNFIGAPTSSSITSVGNGWYLCTITVTTSGANTDLEVYPVQSGTTYIYTGDGTSGIYVWGASLVPASDAALPYQRVNTATDYDFDFSKFPPYLKFDGVDDSLYTSAIDFTSTDKMTVFAGVHKANTSPGIVVEASALSDTSDGSFSYVVGGWADTREYFSTRGTVNRYPTFTVAPPATSVLSAASDISGDLITGRANGVQVINSPGDLGTGNFGNYPLYIGRRNNASLPFNGRIYQLAIKGKALSAAEIATVESFVNSKTKAF